MRQKKGQSISVRGRNIASIWCGHENGSKRYEKNFLTTNRSGQTARVKPMSDFPTPSDRNICLFRRPPLSPHVRIDGQSRGEAFDLRQAWRRYPSLPRRNGAGANARFQRSSASLDHGPDALCRFARPQVSSNGRHQRKWSCGGSHL